MSSQGERISQELRPRALPDRLLCQGEILWQLALSLVCSEAPGRMGEPGTSYDDVRQVAPVRVVRLCGEPARQAPGGLLGRGRRALRRRDSWVAHQARERLPSRRGLR